MSNRLYKLIVEANVFTAPSKDELMDRWLKQVNAVKNPDGSYDVEGSVGTLKANDLKPLVKNRRLFIRFNKVGGIFSCARDKLISLEGCPQEVGIAFYCYSNQLTSLVGGPVEVGDDYICSDNRLTTLEGAPEIIPHTFNCSRNKLVSLEGAPREVGGAFVCDHNAVKFTEEQVRAVCDVKGKVFV